MPRRLSGAEIAGLDVRAREIVVRRNRNSTALRPFWEFAVHLGGTVKSVLVPLSAIGRISVPTRWFVQVQLGRSQVPRWPQAARRPQAARWAQCTYIDIHFFSGRQKRSSSTSI